LEIEGGEARVSEKISLDKAAIQIASVRLSGYFLSEGRLPAFRGATLRGGLGFHLRRTVCNNLKRSCQDCFLAEECAYSNFFYGILPKDRNFIKLYDNVPQPYLLVLPLEEPENIHKEDPLCFTMKIFGKASELFPYVAYSFIQMGEKGLGKDKIPFEISRIEQPGVEVLYEKSVNRIMKPNPQIAAYDIMPIDCNDPLEIRFFTPVRIRKNGQTLKTIRFEDLIEAALRRITIMNYFYGTGQIVDNEKIKAMIEHAKSVEKVNDATEYYSFRRYSGRQERTIELDGLTGTAVFKKVTPELAGILKFAQTIGLGKSTSFGFGNIEIKAEREGGMNG